MMLTLIEELFLLTIDDEKGTVIPFVGEALRFGLAGALLAELALLQKVTLHNQKLSLADDHPTGDELFDAALLLIAKEKHSHKATYWVNTLASKKLTKQVATRLSTRNVLRVEEKRFVWVIPYEAYPDVETSAKFWVKQHLRSVVLGGEKPETKSIVLLSLLKACRLLDLVFTRDEQKAARKKVSSLVKGESFGLAVSHTIAEIEDAAAAAAVGAG